jgi:hypothetical protein
VISVASRSRLPAPPSAPKINDGDADPVHPMQDMLNKLQYLRFSGDRIEHSLRNSIEIKVLIEQEAKGNGHLTITDFLNVIQDMYTSGKIHIFDDIIKRKKPVNTPQSDLQRENEMYRHILERIMQKFSKKSSGYKAWAEAIRILLERIDNKQYD